MSVFEVISIEPLKSISQMAKTNENGEKTQGIYCLFMKIYGLLIYLTWVRPYDKISYTAFKGGDIL